MVLNPQRPHSHCHCWEWHQPQGSLAISERAAPPSGTPPLPHPPVGGSGGTATQLCTHPPDRTTRIHSIIQYVHHLLATGNGLRSMKTCLNLHINSLGGCGLTDRTLPSFPGTQCLVTTHIFSLYGRALEQGRQETRSSALTLVGKEMPDKGSFSCMR